ncbi:hypothetical protein [Acinetobacter bereziniae]|uniref:hypothetical protein n=1 Tax=Acinetobacter bereziniae TaxID=106648 RepID=UPI0021E3E96E|nr:hypothetical protein [Acinetobacter bereziniae]MCV2441905.1 hypothetical protein [Acinetobacter bereziniae]
MPNKVGMVVYIQFEILKSQKDSILKYIDENELNVQDKQKIQHVVDQYNYILNIYNEKIINIEIKDYPIDLNDKYVKFLVQELTESLFLIENNRVQKDKVGDFFYEELLPVISNLKSYLEQFFNNKALNNIKIESEENYQKSLEKIDEIYDLANQSKILINDLRNKSIHEIYDEDFNKFNKIAKYYEISFYALVFVLVFYFFGYYLSINIKWFHFTLAENISNIHSAGFYIQKISLLIISTTLGAFILKRSFMNRRLADESYRIAKELLGLSRYVDSLPNDLQEKIKFDLAYKYFGREINSEGYASSANLINESIKSNTEFLKAVKGLEMNKEDIESQK